MKNLGILGSSTDTSQLSTTVTGLFIGGAVVIVMIAEWLGFEITTDEITTFGISLGSMLAFLVTTYGLLKKVVIAIQQKFSSTPNIVKTEVVTTTPTADSTVEIKTTTISNDPTGAIL